MIDIILAISIVSVATFIILNLGRLSKKLPFKVSGLEYINAQLKYQMLLFAVALLVIATIFTINSTNFVTYVAVGNISAPAKGVAVFGIAEGESWLSLGLSLSFFITLITATFVYMQFRNSTSRLREVFFHIPWVILFSLFNSFSEEVVYRLGFIVPLAGNLNTDYILLVSAIAFGLPHLRGMPNGILGAFLAGILGWLLAKSVIETHGVFWAWLIHFLQDIVIFLAYVMSAVEKSKEQN